MARCECTVVVEYEETVVTVEPGDMTVTVEPEGPQGIPGPPGAGVTDDSLNIGNYTIQWNSGLDSLDIVYQEGN